jgi:hypothetical protein
MEDAIEANKDRIIQSLVPNAEDVAAIRAALTALGEGE